MYERHAHPGHITPDELDNLLDEANSVDLPIWIKIGIGRGIIKLINYLEKARKSGYQIAALTIDGHGGGTGMSPWLIMNEMAINSATVFSQLKRKPKFDILIAGGLTNGLDIAKVMMLGAAGGAMGRAFLIAASRGPSGIVNFVNALKEELQMVCASLRLTNVQKLIGRKENLIALDYAAASHFGLPLRPRL